MNPSPLRPSYTHQLNSSPEALWTLSMIRLRLFLIKSFCICWCRGLQGVSAATSSTWTEVYGHNYQPVCRDGHHWPKRPHFGALIQQYPVLYVDLKVNWLVYRSEVCTCSKKNFPVHAYVSVIWVDFPSPKSGGRFGMDGWRDTSANNVTCLCRRAYTSGDAPSFQRQFTAFIQEYLVLYMPYPSTPPVRLYGSDPWTQTCEPLLIVACRFSEYIYPWPPSI